MELSGKKNLCDGYFKLIREVSESDATVLIQYESGNGKKLVANVIQVTSRCKDKLFVKNNYSINPENLLSSKLFGYI